MISTILSFVSLSLMTMNSQGCELAPEGAQRAASMIFSTCHREPGLS